MPDRRYDENGQLRHEPREPEKEEQRPYLHYSLIGLHDMDDHLSELTDFYREHGRSYGYAPHYGHRPDIHPKARPHLEHSTHATRGASEPLMGRGPKGYHRSDGRIREDICDRLMTSWMDAENVDVLVLDGDVTLQGTVRSWDEKHAIEALTESVLGVRNITSALRIGGGEQVREDAKEPERRADSHPDDSTLHS